MAEPLRSAPPTDSAARPGDPLPLVTGAAPMGRRGRAAARYKATQQALVRAVWQRLGAWVSEDRQTEALRRSLTVGVRGLIARYRTRQITAEGKLLTVRLAVTLDEQALVKRLRALGIPVLSPGVLLLAHCQIGSLHKPLASALASTGIRSVTGPWSPETIPDHVAAVRARPEEAIARARQAKTSVVVVASCQGAPPQTPARGVTAAGLGLLLTVHAKGEARPTLWRSEHRATGLGSDVAAAQRAALELTLKRLSGRLVRDLARALPRGPGRAIPIQLLGGMTISAALDLAQRIPREITGVDAVVPQRLAQGELWFEVRTVHDQSSLVKALARLTPPEGLQLSAQILRPSGHVALSVRVMEETP